MIKRTLLLLFAAVTAAFAANAQYRLIYNSYAVDAGGDTSHTEVLAVQNCLRIASADPAEENPIPGIAQHITYIDYSRDTAFYQLYYTDNEQYYCGFGIQNDNDYT